LRERIHLISTIVHQVTLKAQEEPMNTGKCELPVSASTVAVLAVMAIVLLVTGHVGEVMAVALGGLLFVRLLAGRHADRLLDSQVSRHGDYMD
jgi:hypothetical protein